MSTHTLTRESQARESCGSGEETVEFPTVVKQIAWLVALGSTACVCTPGMDEGPGEPVSVRTRPADGMRMVYVPGGRFSMGIRSPGIVLTGNLKDASLRLHVFRDQRPRHTVCLDPYWIDRTEVTVAMFRAFVDATGYLTTAERDGWGKPWRQGPKEEEWPRVAGVDWQHPSGPESFAADDHPVVQVSWEDAASYCAWVTSRLPTEAQWEFAARGGDDRRFPWGNHIDGTRLNSCDAQCPVERWRSQDLDDGYPFTAPVGSYPSGASPYGALDMAGNVWEWVADWYEPDHYEHSSCWNPSGPASGSERVMRGGAWYDGECEAWTTTTVRYKNPPWDRYQDVGFRCAARASDDPPFPPARRHGSTSSSHDVLIGESITRTLQ